MRRSSSSMRGTACLCALGALFSLWAAFGSGAEVCFTAGCPLFKPSSPGEPSLWWLGMAGFAVLFVLAMLGRAWEGLVLSALGVAGDCCLLLLMALSAPCFNCLVVALLLFLAFLSFRRAARRERRGPQERSALAAAWLFLFACAVGLVLNSAPSLWAITENEEDASVRMFFSPSCPSCRQGVERLGGRVDVAFYPVAESGADLAKVARMEEVLAEGGSMVEAMEAAASVGPMGALSQLSPSMLLLRFRMLRNKAHVFLSGSRVVPYLEYRGLPSFLADRPAVQAPPVPAYRDQDAAGDDALPVESSVAGQCGGEEPSCDEDEDAAMSRRRR